jgi:hypothetical protein
MHSAASVRIRRVLGRLLAGSLLASTAVALTPGTSSAEDGATESVVAVTSESVVSTPLLWRTGDGSIAVSGSAADGITVDTGGGPSASSFRFRFAAPAGESLAVGRYERTDVVDDPDNAALEIDGPLLPCPGEPGEFEVLDLAPDLSRFRIVFRGGCSNRVFGEIRWNTPATETGTVAMPSRLLWPAGYPGFEHSRVPVIVYKDGTNPGPFDAAITAGDSDFLTYPRGCVPGPAGDFCIVEAGFVPSAAGTRNGTLTITGAEGAWTRTVALTGRGIPGHNSWETLGDPVDPYLDEEQPVLTPSNATFTALAPDASTVIVSAVDRDALTLTARFEAGAGHPLVAGTRYVDSVDAEPAGYAGPRLSVQLPYTNCPGGTGSFTVREATYVDGDLTGFSATFARTCSAIPGVLYGSVAWQAEQAAQPITVAAGSAGIAPQAVQNLSVKPGYDDVTLTWLNPRSPDWVSTVVRIAAGTTAPASPTSGTGVYAGQGTTATVKNLKAGSTYSISVFSKDSEGLTTRKTRIIGGSATTFRLSTTRAVYGKKVTATGKLVDPRTGKALTGQPVRIWLRKPGSTTWFSGPSAKTTSTGTYSIGFYPDRSYDVFVFYDGGSNLGSGAGAVRVAVAPKVEVDQQYKTVKRGKKFGLAAYVWPAKEGQTAQLQQLIGGKWKTIRDIKLHESTWTTFYRTARSAGTLKFRVYRAASGGRTSAVSRTITMTVT